MASMSSSGTAAQNDGKLPESAIDVLIIGAGPAGVMAYNWLAKYAAQCGLTVRIIDKRAGGLDAGQADGLNSRSLEILESLGIFEHIDREGSKMSEINFWNPDPRTGHLTRTARIPDTVPGLSRFQQTILNQSRIEHHLIEDALQHCDGKIVVERGVLPESLEVDTSLLDDPSAYPCKVTLRHLSAEEANPNAFTGNAATGETKSGLYRSSLLTAEEEEALYSKKEQAVRREVVRARYVIGCDGAHSWTRRTLGIGMLGEQTDYVWGVLDLRPLTNFPDIRSRCAIHSANSGSVMVIPQMRGLVRLYIQLPVKVEPGAKLDRSKVTPDFILDTARAVLHPYTLDCDHVEWFTGYHIGQRLTESFSAHGRVFLAGDACHTHSPKAGQGMNTSMQDTFNLAWKLGHVVAGLAKPSLLESYTAERRTVAQALIDFDTKFSKLFSGKPASKEDMEGVDLGEFQKIFETGNYFAAGMIIDYASQGGSILVDKSESKQELASLLPVGKRFFSAQVVNVASATAVQLTTCMLSNGAFRLLVFPGKVAEPAAMERLRRLASYLDGADSVVSKYTPAKRPRDSVIDVLTIHSSERTEVDLYAFPQPSIFPPHKYNKIYVDGPSYHRGDGHAYEAFGIDKTVGALVIVRPDQYVSLVVGLEDTDALDRYFGRFMLPAPDGGHPASKIAIVHPPDFSKLDKLSINPSKTAAGDEELTGADLPA